MKRNLQIMNSIKLDPNFVTGLVDTRGSFYIKVSKKPKEKLGISIELIFSIVMPKNELYLLNKVRKFFLSGVIQENKKGEIELIISSINSINNNIIPHFEKYSLRGIKHLDFLLFKDVVDVINTGDYLTLDGINKIQDLVENMNINKDNIQYNTYYTINDTLDGHYINGFIAGSGTISLIIADKNFGRMTLQISQPNKNSKLLLEVANYFKSSNKIYSHGKNSVQLSLSGFKLWDSVIFKHFIKYPLYGAKNVPLNKLFLIRDIIKNKNHLVQLGKTRHWKPEYKAKVLYIWNSVQKDIKFSSINKYKIYDVILYIFCTILLLLYIYNYTINVFNIMENIFLEYINDIIIPYYNNIQINKAHFILTKQFLMFKNINKDSLYIITELPEKSSYFNLNLHWARNFNNNLILKLVYINDVDWNSNIINNITPLTGSNNDTIRDPIGIQTALPTLRLNTNLPTNVGLGIRSGLEPPKELLNYNSDILYLIINGLSPSLY